MPTPYYTELSLSDYLLKVSPDFLAYQIETQDPKLFQCLLQTFCWSSPQESLYLVSAFAVRLIILLQSQQISHNAIQNCFINTVCLETKLSLLQYVIFYCKNDTNKLNQLMTFLNILISHKALLPESLCLMIAKLNNMGENAYNYSLMIGYDHSQLLYNHLLSQWKSGILSSEKFSEILLLGTRRVLQFQTDNNIRQHFLNLNVLVQYKKINFIELKNILTSTYKSAVDFAIYPHRSNLTVLHYINLLRQCAQNGAWSLSEYHQFIEKANLPSSRTIQKNFFDKFPSYANELKLCLAERNSLQIKKEKEEKKEEERKVLINNLPGLGILVNNLNLLFNPRNNIRHEEFSYYSSERISNGNNIRNNL